MARKEQNPQQIIRKDGNNCFVEVLNSSFEIDRVLFRFINYDKTRESGSKITASIDIYLTFEQFFRIAYDILDSRTLINALANDKKKAAEEEARTGNRVYTKPRILHMGGTSADSLKMKGKSRPDNMSISRVLKIMAGNKLPIMLMAEQGPGQTDSKGLIVPRYGNKPEQKVIIPLSADDTKELLLMTREVIRSYLNYRAMTLFATNRMNNENSDNNQNPQNNYSSNYNKNSGNYNTGYKKNSYTPEPPADMTPPDDLFDPDDFPQMVPSTPASPAPKTTSPSPSPTQHNAPQIPPPALADEPPEMPSGDFDFSDDLFGGTDFFNQ